MSPRTLGLTEALHQYIIKFGLREPEALRLVRTETAPRPDVNMQIAPEQGQLMAMLVRLLNARRCLEIGAFTGYSALAVALALPTDGQIVVCEISDEFAELARRNWTRAGVTDKIDLRIGSALGTLDRMLEDGEAGSFDMAFIDADKENLSNYYDRCLKLIRAGGLVLIDNTLWDGAVADPSKRDPSTEAIRAVNQKVHTDRNVDMVLLPIGDGLTLARKTK
jgi:predicted O-methyltransferase YrrM